MDKYWLKFPSVEGFKRVALHEKKGFYRFADEKDNLLPGKFSKALDFCNGFAIVGLPNQDKLTFMDKEGKLFAGRYVECRNFSEGLAPVKHENGKWGYVNENGKETRAIFDFAYKFENGKAHVILDQKHHYIDKTGKKLEEPAIIEQLQMDI
ncbi:MAG: hypothetical protein CVV59_00920 [Tenericutes bacterium HGW-Tenericutes-4]|jgi:hypothetical protein|nr:MAG: hypothetical protein CVV59_00920 [Tenericutes bacterium HGW-Tenericutes-4]